MNWQSIFICVSFCFWMNIYTNLVLNGTYSFIFPHYYKSCIFLFCQSIVSQCCFFSCFFCWCCCIYECFLCMFCCVAFLNLNHFFKTMGCMYFLSSVFAIIHYALNVCHLCQDTIVLVHVFDEVPRNKDNLTPINTINHPINCQCRLLLSCIPNLHLQKIVWIMQEQKLRQSMMRIK